MPESNLELFKRWFEEVWNQRRTATVTELFAPNGISHGVAEDGSDLIGPKPSSHSTNAFSTLSPTCN
jgi:hypothetical protein